MLSCIICGKSSGRIDGICENCFFERNSLLILPEYLDVTYCETCGSVLVKKRWLRAANIQEAIRQVLDIIIDVEKDTTLHSYDIKPEFTDELQGAVIITAKIDYRDIEVTRERKLVCRLQRAQCSDCSRQKGNYFESTLQLRYTQENSERAQEKLEQVLSESRRRNKREIVAKSEEVPGGVDIFLFSNQVGLNVARKMAEAFGTTVQNSPALYGRKEGREVYRITYLVRVPHFLAGDVVIVDMSPHLALSFKSGKAAVRSFINGNTIMIQVEDVRSKNIIRKTDFIQCQVVSVSPDEITLLETQTGRTWNIAREKTTTLSVGDDIFGFVHDELFYIYSKINGEAT